MGPIVDALRTETETSPKPWRSVTTLVTVAMTSGTLLPVALGTLAPFIVEDLDISRSRLGVLVTVTFLSATITALFAGRVADRSGQRAFFLLMFLWSAGVLFGTSVAPSYLWLLLPFALAGIPLAAANP